MTRPRSWLALLALTLLAACARLPEQPIPPRDTVQNFALEGRFALKLTQPDGKAESAGGRIAWTHRQGVDRVLLSSPLGIGLAEIDSSADGAVLRSSDGRSYRAEEPDSLVAELTGQPLPIRRLPGWLLGRAQAGGTLERDALARPLRLHEAGWQIDYQYGDDNPDALPTQLQARNEQIELRLRIESWKTQP